MAEVQANSEKMTSATIFSLAAEQSDAGRTMGEMASHATTLQEAASQIANQAIDEPKNQLGRERAHMHTFTTQRKAAATAEGAQMDRVLRDMLKESDDRVNTMSAALQAESERHQVDTTRTDSWKPSMRAELQQLRRWTSERSGSQPSPQQGPKAT